MKSSEIVECIVEKRNLSDASYSTLENKTENDEEATYERTHTKPRSFN